MSDYFVDTSGLAKRYVTELGSAWVRSWTDAKAGNTIVISGLAIVETVAALARRNRQGLLSDIAFSRLRSDFLLHVDYEYIVVALEQRIRDGRDMEIHDNERGTFDSRATTVEMSLTEQVNSIHSREDFTDCVGALLHGSRIWMLSTTNMAISTCPVAIIQAPIGKVWALLADPASYDQWWDAHTRRIVPEVEPAMARHTRRGLKWTVPEC